MRKLSPQRPSPGRESGADPVGRPQMQDSAWRHVAGSALYVDDMPTFPNQLHVATGRSPHARGYLRGLDLERVRSAPGVVDVISAADIPGHGDIAPVYDGDPLLADGELLYLGQPVFAVAATSFEAAQRAVALAELACEPLEAVVDLAAAVEREYYVLPPNEFCLGEPEQALLAAPLQLDGEISMAGQEHFYLEGQVAQAVPTEEGGVHVYSSSQHPSEVQKLVAGVLGLPIHAVQAEVRRMGGGFGGKESQAAMPACLAALFAVRTGRPVRHRLPRRDDMVQTGKRHPFWNRFRAGFDRQGRLHGAIIRLAGDCGCSPDLSQGIVDRAMFHADNAYNLNAARITGLFCRTDKVSNTAFRGFGGPQGLITCEAMLDDVARRVRRDPLDVRLANLYREGDVTPYGQPIEESVLPELLRQLADDCDYRARREAIARFNAGNDTVRRGLALTPVKFGISFTAKHLNQAGALVHIYTDGSIHLNHGGTEMGQGLHTKVAQVVARALGVSLERVMVSATRTDKVPNTSPTAASSGSDINGMAALDACNRIKRDLVAFAADHFRCDAGAVHFAADRVHAAGESMDFEAFIKLAYLHRVSLSANGFYRTPAIGFDREAGWGQPFFYFANGAACSQVRVSALTGEYRVERVDILHDVGDSLNPAIDLGQIEGGFVQGLGWLTTEELSWDDSGRLLSDGPANYKIPTAFDLPEELNVRLFDRPNHADTIYRSKAVGEPPLMLAVSTWCALRDACASWADYAFNPRLDAPATPERVYWAIQQARAGRAG
jgi:xanthine dehydrogenase large subunit